MAQVPRLPRSATTTEEARAFIARAVWTLAETIPWAPHECCTRWTCRARRIEEEFEQFALLIGSDAGYGRPWGRHRWRSLALDEHVFWLHWNPVSPVHERTVINRWLRDAMAPEPAAPRGQTRAKVLEALKDGPKTAGDIAAATGVREGARARR